MLCLLITTVLITLWELSGHLLTDNPTNAQLANDNNWAITYDADLIPIVELIVNSPLDTGTNP